jgi:hypothetical protein
LDYSADNSIEYYREREQHALKLAESAASPAIRKIHLEMADGYRTLIAQLSGTEGLRAQVHDVNDQTKYEAPHPRV